MQEINKSGNHIKLSSTEIIIFFEIRSSVCVPPNHDWISPLKCSIITLFKLEVIYAKVSSKFHVKDKTKELF